MNIKRQFPCAKNGHSYNVACGLESLERKLEQVDDSKDISGWEIRGVTFPENFSFVGWNIQGTRFMECDVSEVDFTDAKTKAMELDCCTITQINGEVAKGLDLDTLAENRMPDPYAPTRRRRSDIPKYGAQRLT